MILLRQKEFGKHGWIESFKEKEKKIVQKYENKIKNLYDKADRAGISRDSEEIRNAQRKLSEQRVEEINLARSKAERWANTTKPAIKKAAPWVIGGTAIAGATAAGIKIAKKKKAKKEDK